MIGLYGNLWSCSSISPSLLISRMSLCLSVKSLYISTDAGIIFGLWNNILGSSGRPFRPFSDRRINLPPGGTGGPPIGKKGLGVFSPPRQPALEELVIQVDNILEELQGWLLLRKPPGRKPLSDEFFEFFGASLFGHFSSPSPHLIPGNGSRQRRPPPGKSRGLRRFSGWSAPT